MTLRVGCLAPPLRPAALELAIWTGSSTLLVATGTAHARQRGEVVECPVGSHQRPVNAARRVGYAPRMAGRCDALGGCLRSTRSPLRSACVSGPTSRKTGGRESPAFRAFSLPGGYSKGVRKSGRREHDGSGASRPPGVLLGASGTGAGRWGDVTPRSARACPLPPLLHRSPILGKGDPPPGNTREGRPVPMLRRTRPRISSCPPGRCGVARSCRAPLLPAGSMS